MLSCSSNVIDGGGRCTPATGRGHRGSGSSGRCQLSASPPAWRPRNHCCQYWRSWRPAPAQCHPQCGRT
eukprot:9740587-Prorocentrum_lima.AAC.1